MTPEEQAHIAALDGISFPPQSRRRLSWLRLAATLLAVAAVAAAVVFGFQARGDRAEAAAPVSMFAPYVDVTATPQFAFEDPDRSAGDVVLSFVVSAPNDACLPSWGGAYSLDQAATGMDLDRRIARLREGGGQIAVSFGGQRNSELAVLCTDPVQLQAAYMSVIQRYAPTAIDLDIEGDAASSPQVNARRAAAIAAVQAARKSAGNPLPVWLTLPISPTGLTSTGQSVLSALLAAHVELAGVNALTMDYGTPTDGRTMAELGESALTALAPQLAAAYTAGGSPMSTAEAWQHIGATPMIGQNDVAQERFQLSDASQLLEFAQQHTLGRLSMWSLNRDQSCGPNYANVQIVSPNCSGIAQDSGAFLALLSNFHRSAGHPSQDPTAGPSSSAGVLADDPATSPYPIWRASQAYPKGTKIVWHRNVYEAKWYTQGDVPDAPVAQQTDTPWTLIGPVLPGETPAPTPTLAAGTYPDWNATQIYVAGDRVLHDGIGYQAKWWTQGDVPGLPVQSPSDTPWEPLTATS